MMWKDLLLTAVLAATAAASGAMAQSTQPVQPRTRVSGGAMPAEHLLKQNVSVEFRKKTLAEVVDALREMSGANIVVDWNVLQQYGITRDNHVSLPPVQDLPIAKVLQLVLDQLSATLGGITQLTWVVEDDVVLILTKDELATRVSNRIYMVGDLLDVLGSPRPGGTRDRTVGDDLVATITRTIEPKSWTAKDSPAAMRLINDQLIVSQTTPAHEAIADLLDKLLVSARAANPLWKPVEGGLQGTTLRAALEQLAQEAHVALYVNWPSLEAAGVEAGARVDLQAGNVPLGTALQFVLDSARQVRLGYVFEQGTVIVGTQDYLAQAYGAKFQQQRAKETEAQISLVDKMKDTYADPIAAGVVAIGAIKAELQRSGQDVAEGLEKVLDETQAQALRNALHMTLRDLYSQSGNQEKVMDHLTRMLDENDMAYITGYKSGVPATQRSRQ
jgi:hypothetical protein